MGSSKSENLVSMAAFRGQGSNGGHTYTRGNIGEFGRSRLAFCVAFW